MLLGRVVEMRVEGGGAGRRPLLATRKRPSLRAVVMATGSVLLSGDFRLGTV